MHDRMMSGGEHFNHQYPEKQVHKSSEKRGGEEYPTSNSRVDRFRGP